MSESVTTHPATAPIRSDEGGPNIRPHARIAGLLYVALFILGPMVFLGGKAVALVPGDPTATMAALREIGPDGLRTGLVIEAAIFLIEVVLASILYVIFRPVQQAVAMAAMLARFAEAVIQGANLLPGFLLIALVGGTLYEPGMPGSQVDELAYLFLDANGFMVLVWGMFFGLHVVLLAWLIFASGFLPRWLGVLLAFAGVGYLAQSFGLVLWPELRETLDLMVIVLSVPGELALTLWLLFRGVDEVAWRERALAG